MHTSREYENCGVRAMHTVTCCDASLLANYSVSQKCSFLPLCLFATPPAVYCWRQVLLICSLVFRHADELGASILSIVCSAFIQSFYSKLIVCRSTRIPGKLTLELVIERPSCHCMPFWRQCLKCGARWSGLDLRSSTGVLGHQWCHTTQQGVPQVLTCRTWYSSAQVPLRYSTSQPQMATNPRHSAGLSPLCTDTGGMTYWPAQCHQWQTHRDLATATHSQTTLRCCPAARPRRNVRLT
jgi:hypothetical protein